MVSLFSPIFFLVRFLSVFSLLINLKTKTGVKQPLRSLAFLQAGNLRVTLQNQNTKLKRPDEREKRKLGSSFYVSAAHSVVFNFRPLKKKKEKENISKEKLKVFIKQP